MLRTVALHAVRLDEADSSEEEVEAEEVRLAFPSLPYYAHSSNSSSSTSTSPINTTTTSSSISTAAAITTM